MSDPLRDERFPDRPQTEDFWRLSDAVLQNDAIATEQGIEAAMKGLIDIDSAVYMGVQRAGMAGMIHDPRVVSMWLDGVALGIRFQQAGGHRD